MDMYLVHVFTIYDRKGEKNAKATQKQIKLCDFCFIWNNKIDVDSQIYRNINIKSVMINTGKNRHIQMWTTYEKITYNTEIAKISHFSVFLSILGSNQYKVLSLGLMTNNPRHSSITDLNIQNYPHNNLFDLIYQSFIPIIKKNPQSFHPLNS